ncbi:MAG: right-handed parallel beta-helix repeat-containing protein, partial [Burkholderiales bacterium]|nr:right-handed parallel beta-helix repeat-containing protein [Burkholderiales bacterium]
MKSRAILPQARLSALASLLATTALLAACGGGGGGKEADKSLASSTPSTPASAQSAAEPASAASDAASAVAAAASAAASAAVVTPSGVNVAGAGAQSTAVAKASSGDRATADSGTASGSTALTLQARMAASLASAVGTTGTSTAAAPTASTLSVTATAAAPTELRLYVETTGDDAADGAAQTPSGNDGPVKTLARAQQLARSKLLAMQAGTIARTAIRITIGPGEYPLKSTLYFGPSDAGTKDAPVSYEARQAGTVLISGSVDLGTKTAPASATPLTFAAPADSAAMNGAAQLFINGRRADLARQPNAGSAWFVQKPVVLSTDVAGSQGSEAFAPSPGDLTWMTGLSASDKKRAVVEVMQAWSSGQHRISTLTTPAGSVRIAPKARWPFLSFGVSQRYYVENVVAALDAPGEWIYDDGSIRYIRRNDEAGAQLKATLPILDKLMVIAGDSTRAVQSLYFTGLSFGYTRYLTPDAGFTDGQGVLTIGAAITVDKARDVVFDTCTIYRTGGWGIWLRDSVRDSKIINSSLKDLGAGGIKVGLSSQSPADLNATGNNIIANNVVADTGQILPGANAVWLGQTWDNQLLRNTIYNTSYTAISVGWSWGYQPATSGRNIIQGNLLYNIGQRQLSDMAAIYTLGVSPGTVISNNIIRSVRGYIGYGAGAWGIYNDEGTTGVIMEQNVILGTDSGAYHLHYGKDDTLRNNIMSGGDTAEVRVTAFETGTNLSILNNLLAPKTLQPFDRYAEAPGVTFQGNEATPTLSGPGLLLDKCGSGCSLGSSSIQSSTSPTDVRSSNATFSAVILNAANAWTGSTDSAQQAVRISALSLPPVNDAPTAIIVPFVADIAGSAEGARPSNLVYIPRDNTSSIRVELRPDMPAGKCLVFNDAATYANRWEPFAYAQLSHLAGSDVIEFDLKIDSTTNLRNEWRDSA